MKSAGVQFEILVLIEPFTRLNKKYKYYKTSKIIIKKVIGIIGIWCLLLNFKIKMSYVSVCLYVELLFVYIFLILHYFIFPLRILSYVCSLYLI